EVAVRDGRAESVTLTNVPSFLMRRDAHVEVPGLGTVPYDLGFGGNFYAFVELEDLALPFDRRQKDRLLAAGLAIMEALNTADEPVHPEREDIRGVHHVHLAAPGSDARHSRHAMAIHPGWFDRAPCGTETSARIAQHHDRGQLPVGADVVNGSFNGPRFVGPIDAT